MQPVKDALKIRLMQCDVGSHARDYRFEKMRVSYAFQLFGTNVLQSFHLFKNKLETTFRSISATQDLFR